MNISQEQIASLFAQKVRLAKNNNVSKERMRALHAFIQTLTYPEWQFLYELHMCSGAGRKYQLDLIEKEG